MTRTSSSLFLWFSSSSNQQQTKEFIINCFFLKRFRTILKPDEEVMRKIEEKEGIKAK